jgi:hypothetical protein
MFQLYLVLMLVLLLLVFWCCFIPRITAVARVSAVAAVPTAVDVSFATSVSYVSGDPPLLASLLLLAFLLLLAPCHVVYIPAVAGVHDIANVPVDDFVPAVATFLLSWRSGCSCGPCSCWCAIKSELLGYKKIGQLFCYRTIDYRIIYWEELSDYRLSD